MKLLQIILAALDGGDVVSFLIVLTVVLVTQWLRCRKIGRASTEYPAGYDLGYLRGRRDERQVRAIDPHPSDQQTSARLPLIVESFGDGFQRRFDR